MTRKLKLGSKVKLKDADIIRKPQEVQNLDELTPE